MAKPARTRRMQMRALKFAQAICSGATQLNAWIAATPKWEDTPEDSRPARASEFAKHPVVERKLHELQRDASIAAIDSHARFHTELQQDIDQARLERNWTAVMAGHRIRGSSGHYLAETFNIADDRGVTDEQLVQRMGKGDPNREALARKLLGSDTFDQPKADVVPIKLVK